MAVEKAAVNLSSVRDIDPVDALRRALDRHHPKIALACSFQAEEIILIDMMKSIRDDVRVFSLDTGRLDEETYDVAEEVRKRYGIEIEWVHPKQESVEKLIREKGLYSFRQSVQNRKECCFIRKVEPLNRVLSQLNAWITGLRREQGVTRGDLPQFEIDDSHGGIEKVNPIVHWTVGEVWKYVRDNNLPYNKLYERGYTQIGCEPCTRHVRPGDDVRAGRWWWEMPEHKECGLHVAGSGI